MAVIQPKVKGKVVKGINYTYHAPTFHTHKMSNSYTAFTAEEMFERISPAVINGRKFLEFDTEDYAYRMANHAMPHKSVRRWVGSGKKAVPVDAPFCISVCDGRNTVTLYDSLENGYVEFQKLRKWLEDPTIEKIFHNAKFDMHMLANVGFRIAGKIHDTVVLAKIINENRPDFSLWGLAEKRPWGIVKFEYMVDTYKKDHKITDYRFIAKELLTEYANADVWNGFKLFEEEFPQLEKLGLTSLYENELEMMLGLWVAERFGMKIDKDYEDPLKATLRKIVIESEETVYKMAGEVFNMNSVQQIHRVMVKLGVDPSRFNKTDKGNISLDKKELERFEEEGVEIVRAIMDYRKNEKLLTTYAIGIYDQRDINYRVHSSINQTEAVTGRMSITKPALQTLPKKDKRIRKAFIPAPKFKLVFMDLDQIEYRMLAHYANATGLIEGIKNGYDVHTSTASIIYGKPMEEVTPEERDRGKTINFSIVYGQGDEASARSLKLSKPEARRFKDHYFAMIPEIQPFVRQVYDVIKVRGFVRNFYGRIRRHDENEAYKAVNSLLQGVAADYIKHKLVKIFRFLMAHGYKSRYINVVHDEILFEIHEDEQFLIPKLRWLMSDFESFRCPITAGVEVGNPSWGEKEKPIEDIVFEPLTAEELETMNNFDIYNGCVFDRVA